ncbi:diguanylate cyclase [Devosia sp.]|uniref:sensor domain-containing diguanylate cyclase n=1 Tax=Devosia sp. TaxID=1871048 RepID=UPI001AC49FF1|nr:diguanylate cyclase [Devosia sp.]MBN9335402.1 diguanylate cyclase [Devosia sp.]
MSLIRLFTDSLRARVLLLVLLGFAIVSVPAFFAFQWVVNSTVVQLGTLFAEKQVLYDRHRGLGTLVREVSLAEALAGSQAVRDWALNEDNPERRARGIAELEHYRRYFADGSYFFVVAASGNYYFNDSANAYAGNQFRYRLDENSPDDAWYYATLALGEGCHLNVNNDANLRVTKVWMNCVIREGRQVLGMLGTGIDLSSFIQEVVNVPQRGVTSMFVDRQGMIQAHRDETLVNLANLADGLNSKRSVYSLVSGTGDAATLRRLFEDVTGGEMLADSAFVTVDGKQTLVGIGYLDKLGWYNVTFMDIDTIIDRRLFVPIGLLLGAMMLGVAVVLVLMFKNQVLDRLTRLETVVRRARVGDYGPALTMGAGRQDEIGRLSSALTQMAARVDDHTRLLETKVRERTQELESLAFRDGQSGILNRRGFAEAHADVAQSGAPYGILLVDVDHFKQINDTHGHAAGDAVIVSVARRIQDTMGAEGTCARWGGDEFIVLLPDCGPKALRAKAHDIMRAAIEAPIETVPGRSIVVSLSIGACLAERGDRLEVATDMADAALYTAKQAGRGRVVVFEKDMRPDPHRHVA